jgi:predicted ATPase
MVEAVRRRRRNLEPPASRFIGRRADLEAIRGLFERGSRLVTLWGPAGMGKTRLALEVAVAWAAAHPSEGVWLCELASSRDLTAVCGAVSRALEAPVAAGKKNAGMVERIGRILAAQGPSLFVADNLEQVIAEATPALDRWVRMAPEVRFLITSRERTRLPGEVSYELAPLSLPSSDDPEQASEAVELFVDRVLAQRRAAAPAQEGAAAVASLVRKLEGIPLAIELAAARADVLGVSGMLGRLQSRLDLLAGGARGVSARQATLRSAIEWSWDLLDEAERVALARCSVFRGGFSIEAASAVLGDPVRALDWIQSLRDKSLLRAIPGAAGVRFSLYEGVRELAAEKLADHRDRDRHAILVRHAEHFLAAGEAAATAFDRTGALDALNRIADDLENLLAVAEGSLDAPTRDRSITERALRALLVIDPVLSTRGPFGAQLELLDRALAAAAETSADPLLQARALDRAERLLTHLGDELSTELAQLSRGFLDLAMARSARLGPRPEEAAEPLAAARARIAHARAGDPSLADRSDDIRLGLRLLERSLSALGDETVRADHELLLAPEARWCRPPGSAWQDLRERHAVRRLLVKLVEQQRTAPGRGLSLAELQEAGWPGERILPDAAANRIYVAFNQMRKIGFKAWLKKDGDGYSLDPSLPVHYVTFDPAAGEAAPKGK